MRAKIEGNNLQINLHDIIDELTDDERMEIIERLSCWENVIAHVGAQLIDGWTDNGYHGAKGCGPLPYTAIDKMRRRIAESSGDIAQREIESLQNSATHAEKSRDEAWAETRRLTDKLYAMDCR